MATLNGTPGNDFLCGTAGIDILMGGGGNDLVEGLGGNDMLFGGTGTLDRVIGRADEDITLTDTQLIGGALLGTDTIAEFERGTLVGGASANTLDASGFTAGRVFISGQGGNDILTGSAINGVLVGGDGADILQGGSNTIYIGGNLGNAGDGCPGYFCAGTRNRNPVRAGL